MGTTELLWTAVPRGFADGGVLVNAHVDFHMKTATPGVDETLAAFPVVNQWPPDVVFEVTITQGTKSFTAPQVGVAPRASRAHWTDTFPPTTTVRDFRPRDLRGRLIHTMPAGKITGALQSIYSEAFLLGQDTLPALSDLRKVGDLAVTTFRNNPRDRDDPELDQGANAGAERWEAARQAFREALSTAGVVDTRQTSDTAFDFFQLFDYYRPVEDLSRFEEPPTATTFTFQEVLAGINAEPELQRLLGLVFELNPIPLEALRESGIADGTVDVRLRHVSGSLPVSTPGISPITRSTLGEPARRFLPQPRDPVNGPLAAGYLRLDDTSSFTISQCDPTDGIKLSYAAGSMQEEQIQLPESAQEDQGLPPLRSGLFVSQNGAAAEMKAKIDATPSSPGALEGTVLYADDLMRGFVTDIWAKQTWRQDSMRSSTYAFPTQDALGPFDEEGYVGRGATAPIDDPDSLNVGEMLYPWEGTPLGITVGKVLPNDPNSSAVVDKPVNQSASPDTPIQISHGLPVQGRRFTRMLAGEDYRFRLRIRHVDGSSVPFDEATEQHASPVIPYLRTEPVSHSVLYPGRKTVPAEGPNVIVLRGDADSPPEHPFTDRWVMPSRSTFEQVIRTRLLDVQDPGNPQRTVIDPATYGLFAARDGFVMATHPSAQTTPGHPDEIYLDESLGTIDIRHLPEPLQDAVALRLEPNFERPGPFSAEYPFVDAFPGTTPLRLRMLPSDAAKDPELIDPEVLAVYIRPGETITGHHAAGVSNRLLDTLALLRWVLDDPNLDDGLKAELRQAVDEGRHTAVSPPEPLTFVYAVRRPLRPATFTLPTSATRRRGDTFAELRGAVLFSRRSTDRVDVDIDWTECIDDGRGAPDAPYDEPRSRRAATTVNIDHGLDNDPERQSLQGLRIEFGDTKHRMLSAGTTATSRYPQHYTEQIRTTVDLGVPNPEPIILPTGNPAKGLVPGFTKVTVTTRSRQGRLVEEVLKPIEPVDASDPGGEVTAGHYAVDNRTGMITFRDEVGLKGDKLFVPRAGDQFSITFLVPPITQVTARDFPINVRSSARPAAPEVRYVIPTFGWSEESEGDTTSSTRSGAGLRVYLERPWFSSGCGEQLAVLLWAQTARSFIAPDLRTTNPISPQVTQWGLDPLFRGSGLPGLYPRPEHFPNRVIEDPTPSYRVDGTPPFSSARIHKVVVAGHDVEFDPVQDCWYADIAIDPGTAYTPFIRLALARYQPHSLSDPTSIADLHLSPVQLAEFAQLAPDRFSSVTVSASNPRRLRVSLSGVSPEECRDDTVRSTVQVTVEERRGGGFEEDLDWTPVTDPIPLTSSGGDDHGVHSGTIILPERPSAQEWRIVFEEFERHGLEPLTSHSTPGVRGRLIHMDTVIVTAGGGGSGEATAGDGAEGPAPIFQEVQFSPPSPQDLEIYEVEFDPAADFGPGPVIREFDTSIGQIQMAFNGLAPASTGQGDPAEPTDPGGPGDPGEPGGPGGRPPGPVAGGPPGFTQGEFSQGQQYTAVLEVLCNPGVLQIPGSVAASTSLDITVQNVDFSTVEVTMPLVEALPLRGGLGPRMFHMDTAGVVTDVTTEVTSNLVRGVSDSLSPFFVGEVAGVQRLAGSGRVETAAEIANATFEPGVEAVFLATANNFPDALAAGPLAASMGSPILLVGNSLPQVTADEIDRLAPAEIIIVGGTAAVPESVETQTRNGFPDIPVRRLAGSSRFATAAAISQEGFPGGAATVYIATGGTFPDALSGGVAAVRDGAPLLLVNTNSIPAETAEELTRLDPDRIVVLGGNAAVGSAVFGQLQDITGASVERLAGADRFTTCAEISQTFLPETPVFIATGGAFPDALAGTPAAGALGGAMLLVRNTSIPAEILVELRRLRPSSIVILGGPNAVSQSIQEELSSLVLEVAST